MSKCNNCNSTLTCGCKKRKAKDGKSVCVNCVNTYNAKLASQKK